MKNIICGILTALFLGSMPSNAQTSSPTPEPAATPFLHTEYWVSLRIRVTDVQQGVVAGYIEQMYGWSSELQAKMNNEGAYKSATPDHNVTTLPNGEKSWQWFQLYSLDDPVVIYGYPSADDLTTGQLIDIVAVRNGTFNLNGSRRAMYKFLRNGQK